MKTTRIAPLSLACACMLALPPPAGAEGKYARRQRLRGEVTDTAPKLDRFAYIDDTAPKPLQLVLVVDTWTARHPRDPKLLPLHVALSYEGNGKPLRVAPDRFELSWEGLATPEKALADAELVCRASASPCRGTTGPSPVYQDVRMLSRRAPLAFDTPRASYRSVQFHSHPALRSLRQDETWLPAQTWTSTLMYFPVPEGFDKWDGVFVLQYVPEDGAPPAVACRFRIQRDPALQADAMRRARRDLRQEDPKRSD